MRIDKVGLIVLLGLTLSAAFWSGCKKQSIVVKQEATAGEEEKLASGSQKKGSSSGNKSAALTIQEEKQIHETILKHASALQLQDMEKRDKARLALYASNYSFTDLRGKSFTKEELLAYQKRNRLRIKSAELAGFKFAPDGDKVIASYTARVAGTNRGLPTGWIDTVVTSVLVKRDGKWQILSDRLISAAS